MKNRILFKDIFFNIYKYRRYNNTGCITIPYRITAF